MRSKRKTSVNPMGAQGGKDGLPRMVNLHVSSRKGRPEWTILKLFHSTYVKRYAITHLVNQLYYTYAVKS